MSTTLINQAINEKNMQLSERMISDYLLESAFKLLEGPANIVPILFELHNTITTLFNERFTTAIFKKKSSKIVDLMLITIEIDRFELILNKSYPRLPISSLLRFVVLSRHVGYIPSLEMVDYCLTSKNKNLVRQLIVTLGTLTGDKSTELLVHITKKLTEDTELSKDYETFDILYKALDLSQGHLKQYFKQNQNILLDSSVSGILDTYLDLELSLRTVPETIMKLQNEISSEIGNDALALETDTSLSDLAQLVIDKRGSLFAVVLIRDLSVYHAENLDPTDLLNIINAPDDTDNITLIKSYALQAVANGKHVELIQMLVPLAQDITLTFRESALDALIKLDYEIGLATLIDFLRKCIDPKTQHIPNHEINSSLKTLVSIAGEDSAQILRDLYQHTENTYIKNRIFPLLVQLLKSVDLLSEIRPPREWMNKQYVSLVADVLFENDRATFKNVLLSLLKDPQLDIHITAWRMLFRLGEETIPLATQYLLNNPNEEIAFQIFAWLARNYPLHDAVPAELWHALYRIFPNHPSVLQSLMELKIIEPNPELFFDGDIYSEIESLVAASGVYQDAKIQTAIELLAARGDIDDFHFLASLSQYPESKRYLPHLLFWPNEIVATEFRSVWNTLSEPQRNEIISWLPRLNQANTWPILFLILLLRGFVPPTLRVDLNTFDDAFYKDIEREIINMGKRAIPILKAVLDLPWTPLGVVCLNSIDNIDHSEGLIECKKFLDSKNPKLKHVAHGINVK